jgi:Xaa-Pro aminopeptidase
MIKDGDEITCIKKACVLGSEIMNHAVRLAGPGLKERAVRDGIEFYIRKRGTARADFDIIVASGANSSMPHAPVSDRRIKRNEMVLIDLGGIYNRYNSDLTRTICVGKITHEFLKLYSIVRDAQKKAIEAIKPGIQAKTIDNISRQYISRKGLGRYFVHSLGHGIGLQAHEKPSISRNSEARLEKGMVITIEPGIYIHGWGGVRIEDDILVMDSGSEILTGRAHYAPCR